MIGNAVARSERALPEFASLDDESLMLAALSGKEALFGSESLAGCRLKTVRYRTFEATDRSRSSALAQYEVAVRGPGDGDVHHREVYVKAFLDSGRAARAVELAGSLSVLADVAGVGTAAYAWLFPDDPRIAGLRRIADPRNVVGHLPRGIAIHPEQTGVSVECLRYKPEDRCTLRVAFDQSGGGQAAIVGKVFAKDSRACRQLEISEMMWERSKASAQGFVVPVPLGCDLATSTLWLSELRGRVLRRSDLTEALIGRIAAALAALHRSEPMVVDSRTISDILSEADRKSGALAHALPTVGDDLKRLTEGLASGRPDAVPGRNVHGAFRLRQLLIDGPMVGLLDFDSVSRGDPIEDVADFVVDLGLGVDPSMGHSIRAFLAAYEAEAGERIDRSRLRWHLPLQFLKRAHWLRTAAHRQPGAAVEAKARIAMACRSARLGHPELG